MLTAVAWGAVAAIGPVPGWPAAPVHAVVPPDPEEPPAESPLQPLAPAPDRPAPAASTPEGAPTDDLSALAAEPGSVRVTLSLFESDLRDALHELSYQAGVNILVTPDVQGSVTAELAGVPLEQALETLLAPFGYVYRWMDSFYLVGLPDPRSLSFGLLSETVAIPVRYVGADKAAALLPDFYRSYVKADDELNRLLVTAPASFVERVRQAVALVDRPPAEVQVRVVVTELTQQASRQLGIDEAGYDGAAAGALEVTVSPMTLSLSYAELMAKLLLFQENQQAEIRANPDVRVTEGQPLRLFAGQTQFFVIASEQTTPRLERVESGVELQVEARVHAPDEVSLSVAPSVSQVIGSDQVVPTLYTNELSTTVRLRDGQTAVLATMSLDSALTGQKQQPGLGDLPLVGWLFRQERREENRRQLVILVTPEVLQEPEGSGS